MRRISRASWLGAVLLCAALLSARQASAQVTFDAFANSFCDGSGTPCTGGGLNLLDYNLTVGAGSNRALAVSVFIGCAGAETAPTITAVTFDPAGTNQALQQKEATSPASSRRGELWALPAGTQPTSGTKVVRVTMSAGLACTGASRLSSGAVAVAGVDQSTTFTDTNIAAGTAPGNGDPALTMTGSGANDFGFHSVCAGDGITNTTETSRWSVTDTNTSCNSFGGATAAGGDTAFSWSIPDDSWIMVGAVFKASGGAAAPTPRLMLLGVGGDE
jgi:hypothetical protein